MQVLERRIEDLGAIPEASGLPFDLALIMPGRLTEMAAWDAERVKGYIAVHARRLIVYAYVDQASGPGALAALVGRAGIEGQLGPVFSGGGVQVAEVLR